MYQEKDLQILARFTGRSRGIAARIQAISPQHSLKGMETSKWTKLPSAPMSNSVVYVLQPGYYFPECWSFEWFHTPTFLY
ncbi:conserved hypothetical protein [Ricinus communis]|uniref:Uncharacterized protein n=1 Tax=Ricinus communis TaxID=3988 RepID=B9S329_RICCO|nr:conserved hypothetical protein [Ricinus communis]